MKFILKTQKTYYKLKLWEPGPRLKEPNVEFDFHVRLSLEARSKWISLVAL